METAKIEFTDVLIGEAEIVPQKCLCRSSFHWD